MSEAIRGKDGRTIGYRNVSSDGRNITYMTAGGKVVARVHDDKTLTSEGKFVGFGDQGVGLLWDAIY
jgi:hypothetical protein